MTPPLFCLLLVIWRSLDSLSQTDPSWLMTSEWGVVGNLVSNRCINQRWDMGRPNQSRYMESQMHSSNSYCIPTVRQHNHPIPLFIFYTVPFTILWFYSSKIFYFYWLSYYISSLIFICRWPSVTLRKVSWTPVCIYGRSCRVVTVSRDQPSSLTKTGRHFPLAAGLFEAASKKAFHRFPSCCFRFVFKQHVGE